MLPRVVLFGARRRGARSFLNFFDGAFKGPGHSADRGALGYALRYFLHFLKRSLWFPGCFLHGLFQGVCALGTGLTRADFL